MGTSGPFPKNLRDAYKYRSTVCADDTNTSVPKEHAESAPASLWPWPEDIDGTLRGLAMANSNIMLIDGHHIILRRDHISLSKKVKIVSGGKMGNEPLYMSYVGPGMLTGVVLGTKHTAPSANEILILLKELAYGHEGGILIILPNSREEVLNFGLAVERARCINIMVDIITVGDDAYDAYKNEYGRRCLAGIVLMFKIAGAMSEGGKNMKDIFVYLRKLKLATISCHITSSSFIGTDFHLGSGLFVETTNIAYLVSLMLDYLVNPNKYFSLHVDEESKFILLLNSYTYDRFLLYGAAKEVMEQLSSRDVCIERIYADTFVTGDRGFSITMVEDRDNSVMAWTEKSCVCYSWPKTDARGGGIILKGPTLPETPNFILGPYIDDHHLNSVDKALTFACKALRNSEALLNSLDIQKSYGSYLVPALEKILSRYEAGELDPDRPYNMLNHIALICEDLVPTILGTIYSIFFSGASQAFLHYAKTAEVKAQMWIDAIFKGIDTVKVFAKIKEGDMTFIDILSPFVYKLNSSEAEEITEGLTICIEKCEELLFESCKLKSPLKRDDLPEVSCQATVIALRAITEGMKVARSTNLPSTEDALAAESVSFEIC